MPQRYVMLLAALAMAGSASRSLGQEQVGHPFTFPESAFTVLMDEVGLGALSGPRGAVIDAALDPLAPSGLAVLSGVREDARPTDAPGISLPIPEDVERRVSGRRITVTVVARKSPGDESDRAFAVAYSTQGDGNSGWRRFELTSELTAHSFTYIAPTIQNGGGGDALGILPDPDGLGGVVEVAAVAVDAPTFYGSLRTAFYDLAVERIPLPGIVSQRGALAKLDDLILVAAQTGELYTVVGPEWKVRPFDMPIPMAGASEQLDAFGPPHKSIFDIAAEPSSSGVAGRFDLYASYLGLDEEGSCLHLELARAVLERSGDDLTVRSGWDEVFRTTPCLPLASMSGLSNGTGGRLAFTARGVILTVGHFEVDPALLVSRTGDYGTIVRLDRDTFSKHTISVGHRNPQGLFVDADGTLFATEHGPRGGDELNVVREGGDYGWPQVTFGTDYGASDWCAPGDRPCDPHATPEAQGHHLGFELPLYAFVPSVGISQIVKVTRGGHFPIWEGDLLVASMVGRTLYRLHLREGRVILAEPIPLEARLRDMVELDDGRIAILTDDAELLIVANAQLLSRPPSPPGTEPGRR